MVDYAMVIRLVEDLLDRIRNLLRNSDDFNIN